MGNGSGEMTQQLKILSTVLEDLSSSPNTTTLAILVSQDVISSSDLTAPGTYMAQRHT